MLQILQQRLHAAIVRGNPAATEIASASRFASDLDARGFWRDIDYRSTTGERWAAVTHLERVLVLARMRRFCSGELDAALTCALDWWLAHDLLHSEWRYNGIVVPRLIGSTALLFEGGLCTGACGKVVEILARSRWSRYRDGAWRERSAVDLPRIAFNVLLRGLIEEIPSLCHEAFDRVFAGVRLAPVNESGIQPDMSFHHNDDGQGTTEHGLSFSEDTARFLILAHGTTWQAPVECLATFAGFLLDGQQWTIYDGQLDGGLALTHSPVSDSALANYAAAIEDLAALGAVPRRQELAAFARRLRGTAGPGLFGHRHFWRSDLAVNQRPGFYSSVRMRSSRTPHAGLEGGLTCLLRRGDEYRDILSVLDRRRLPGATTVQALGASTLADGEDAPAFVGGVTDGEYGVTAMDVRREGLRAHKAWFHFDGSLVCLGSGIESPSGAEAVFTSINQCALRGAAIAYGKGGETHELVADRAYDLSGALRLEHDGLMYQFLEPLPVRARLAAQAGAGEARDVFSLWIDHGIQPRRETYAYAVQPVAPADDDLHRRSADFDVSPIKILANHPALQAVWHRGLRLVGAVFWEPGIVPLPGGGRIAVNRPCVVLCQDRRPDPVRLSIANPTNDAATIHVEYANKCLCFELPNGPRGGQSVTRVL